MTHTAHVRLEGGKRDGLGGGRRGLALAALARRRRRLAPATGPSRHRRLLLRQDEGLEPAVRQEDKAGGERRCGLAHGLKDAGQRLPLRHDGDGGGPRLEARAGAGGVVVCG